MSKSLQWVLGLSAVLIVVAVVASTFLPFFFPQAAWGGWQGTIGPGMMGPGHMFGGAPMMGGFGMPFFGLGMLLWPLLVIGLIVLGVVWLVRAVAPQPQPPAAVGVTCAHCGKPLQAGWKACPYCGEKV